MKKNKNYLTPKLTLVKVSNLDIMTVSVDTTGNGYMSDIFDDEILPLDL